MRTIAFLLALTFATIGANLTMARAASSDPLSTLRRAHPRLLVLPGDWTRLREQIKIDPTAKAWFDQLKSAADKELDAPVAERVLTGPRLLSVSRKVLGRTSLWGGMYQLTGDKKYAERCRKEMLAVAAFSDWHPPHFLDVAEMTNAMGIGYDWIYDTLSESDRATIRQAIVEKGLDAGLKVYASKHGWPTITNNWNQVCNGGLTVGALAVADQEPAVARKIIENARKSIAIAMKQFAPDGGFIEGPGYWDYANQYTAFYLAALQTALGTDFGYLKTPGFAQTGMFRIQSLGPLDRTFNFADAGSTPPPAPEMFWYARVFNHPAYAASERLLTLRRKDVVPFDLWWFNPAGSEQDIANLPKAAMFKRVQVVFMRSAWNDHNAAYVGFKGGDNAASHSHLDLGTFVYDVDGYRWAEDLGPDDYNLLGYFGHQRYDYYRLRTEGHNTLTVDEQNQPTHAAAPIVDFSADPKSPFAIADLSKGYPQAKEVRRGVRLIGKQLLVQDQITGNSGVNFVWNLHTAAKIQLGPGAAEATLSQGDKKLTLRILSPAGLHFEIAPSDIPPTTQSTVPRPQDRNRKPGKKLIIRLPSTAEITLAVLLSPADESPGQEKVISLGQWK